MGVKGLDNLRDHLPAYAGKRIIMFFCSMLLSICIFFGLLILIDLLPRLSVGMAALKALEPWTPVVAVALVSGGGFSMIHEFWQKRAVLLPKYESRAYQAGVLYALAGITCQIASIFHTYVPLQQLHPQPPPDSLMFILASPLTVLAGLSLPYEALIRLVIGLLIMALGFATLARAFLTFGIDYMFMVYLYYPAESKIQDHEIYSVLRHPTYAGILLFLIGAIIVRLSPYSLIFSAIILVGLLCHINLVEERELITRFGETYKAYKKRVPALIVKPRDLGIYLRFVFGAADKHG